MVEAIWGPIRRFLFRTWIERDDYRDRYEHQYEMKCKAEGERDRAENTLEEVKQKIAVKF